VTSDDSPGGPLDVPTLEVMGRRAASHGLVEARSLQPDAVSPRRLDIRLDSHRYPAAVETARLAVGWYEGGEYTVNYVESRGDGRWQCRWDRHPKPDAPSTQFHPPPDAGPGVEPSSLDEAHHLGVLFDALDWTADRVATLHSQ
jgi:hypothetical protein